MKLDAQSVARIMSGGVVAFALLSVSIWVVGEDGAANALFPLGTLTNTSQGIAALVIGFIIDQIRRPFHREIFADADNAIFATISVLAKRTANNLNSAQTARIFWKIVDNDKSLETQSTEVRVFGTATTACVDTTIVASMSMLITPLFAPPGTFHLIESTSMAAMLLGACLYPLARRKHLALCAEQLEMIKQHHRTQVEKIAQEASYFT